MEETRDSSVDIAVRFGAAAAIARTDEPEEGGARVAAATPGRAGVVVIDALQVVREGVRRMVSPHPIDVVAMYPQAEDALGAGEGVLPDVLLFEAQCDCTHLHRTLRGLTLRWPRAGVLLYFAHLSWAALSQAIASGVCGYLPKSAGADELADALLTVAAGGRYVHESVLSRVLQVASGRAGADRLTPREQNVLELLCRGLTNQEIAASLQLTVGTTKVYVSRILSKLGATDRTQAVVRALREHLVTAPRG